MRAYEHVYETVRANLVNGVYAPGSRLNVAGLADDLRVSPVPVRECLARLHGERFLTYQPQCGYRVVAATSERLIDDVTLIFVVFRRMVRACAAADPNRDRARAIVDASQRTLLERLWDGPTLLSHDEGFVQQASGVVVGSTLRHCIVAALDNSATARRIYYERFAPVRQHVTFRTAFNRAMLDGDDVTATRLIAVVERHWASETPGLCREIKLAAIDASL